MESFKLVVLLTKHFAVQTTREQAKRSKHRTNMSKSQVQGWIKHSLYGPPVGPNSCTGTGKVCEFGETSSFAWIFCSHDIKATFETCPGERTSNSLPLPAINWSGRSLTGGKALPRRSRPDASVSVYCDSGCCRVTHRRDDTEPGPGVRAESALFADRRWRVHAAGDGGEVWVEFFLSDPRNVTRGREADSHQRFHREEIKPSVHREKERRRVQQQSEEVRS